MYLSAVSNVYNIYYNIAIELSNFKSDRELKEISFPYFHLNFIIYYVIK